jgi:4-hydroxybenzoate polyprenyltransferase
MSSRMPDSTVQAQLEIERSNQRARLVAVARGEKTGVVHLLLSSVFTTAMLAATFFLSATHQVIVLMLLAVGIQVAYSASVAYSQRRIDALLKLLDLGQASQS